MPFGFPFRVNALRNLLAKTRPDVDLKKRIYTNIYSSPSRLSSHACAFSRLKPSRKDENRTSRRLGKFLEDP